MISLRPDQQLLVQRLRYSLQDNQSVLACCPTGFGKTVVASHMAMSADSRGKRVVFGCHRREIATQTAATFDRFGIRYGYIAAGMPADPFARVHIASADTLRNRRHHLKCDLFVPDEAHLWASDTRGGLISQAKQHGAKVVGLTATPERLDGRPLDMFEDMVCGPSVAELMDAGSLSRYRAFAPVRHDLSGVRTARGDYETAGLTDALDKPSVVGDAVAEYRKRADGLRCIAFAFSRQHGAHVTQAFLDAGVHAVYMDGETSASERRERIAAFADKGGVLVNIQLATEGFDLSAQVGRDVPVEAVSLQRPTQSLALAMQMMGRALRPKLSPAIILDHANVISTHGLPDDDREWSLEGRKRGPAKPGVGTIAIRTCTTCFGVFRPAPVCPLCHAAVEGGSRQVEMVEGELDEVDAEAVRRARQNETHRARDVDSLARVAFSAGRKVGWVIHTMRARGTPVTYDRAAQAMRAASVQHGYTGASR